jgi:hypothetical protein
MNEFAASPCCPLSASTDYWDRWSRPAFELQSLNRPKSSRQIWRKDHVAENNFIWILPALANTENEESRSRPPLPLSYPCVTPTRFAVSFRPAHQSSSRTTCFASRSYVIHRDEPAVAPVKHWVPSSRMLKDAKSQICHPSDILRRSL